MPMKNPPVLGLEADFDEQQLSIAGAAKALSFSRSRLRRKANGRWRRGAAGGRSGMRALHEPASREGLRPAMASCLRLRPGGRGGSLKLRSRC